MDKCCLCDAQADRMLYGRLPMCLDHYQAARTGGLEDAEAAKLAKLWNAPTKPAPQAEPPAAKRGGPAGGETEAPKGAGEDG